MKKRKKEAALNYSAEIRKLKEAGPERLYLLWGEEDYLRDSFLQTVREICSSGDESDFQARVFKDAQIDPMELRYAIDTIPFFSERSLIEIRDLDYVKPGEPDRLIEVIYLSGDQMKALIPEIEKIAAYARGEKVTAADVNAVANRIAESDIFDLTDAIAERRFNTASGILADLLESRDTSVPVILSLLSGQFRRLFLACGARDAASVMELCNLKYDFIARRLLNSARSFQPEQLRRAVELCEEADYRLKSEGLDEKQLLKETMMRIVLEVSDV